jgi:hypothetical protein
LRTAVDQLARNARALVFTVQGVHYWLRRLDEAEFCALHRRSLAVEDDYWFLIQLSQSA